VVDHASVLQAGVAALALKPDTERIKRLLAHVDLLRKWNRIYNLVAVADMGEILSAHVLDSLSVHSYVRGVKVVDVGSGAGFPGIPLAIFQPEKQFVLLETRRKKVRFLHQVVIELGLSNVNIAHTRVEQYPEQECFDTVMSRAFASLERFILVAGRLCKHSGSLLAMKGMYPTAELEVTPAEFKLIVVARLVVPGLERERHVVELLKL
jgi:16S rRNA (guanine527-N7)-methyltransferase